MIISSNSLSEILLLHSEEGETPYKMRNYHSLCPIGIALRVRGGAFESESFSFVEIYFRSFHFAILAESLLLDGG